MIRWGRTGLGGTCLVLALGVAACSGGGSGSDAVPTTEVSSSTVVATTTAAAPVPTRAAPPTTTTRPGFVPPPPPVAVGPFVNGRTEAAPVLGERNGWHLWIEGAGGFFLVDLDTGAITHVDAPGFFGQLYAVEDGLFYWALSGTGGDGLFSIDATGEGREIAGAGIIDFRSARPDRMWARTADGYAEFSVDGTRTNAVATRDWVVGAIGGSFVVADGGAIFLVDVATGVARRWAVGSITNVGRGRIVWRECTAELRCRSWVGTETQPRARAIEPTESRCGEWYEGYHDPCDGSFSADGRVYLATDLSPTGDHRGPSAFELDTTWKDLVRIPGATERQMSGTYEGIALSPDGRWALAVTGAGHVVATEIGSGRLVEFDVARGGGRGAPFALG